MTVLLEAELPLPLYRRGKVRDTFEAGELLLIVSTDRISAFDVVLPVGIPDKGRVLNMLSAFWFDKTRQIAPNHMVELVGDVQVLHRYFPAQGGYAYPSHLVERSMVVKKAERLPVECVVRGYISGSAWAEYRERGTIFGMPLPQGMVESQELSQPLFTPTTKAEEGHDQELSPRDLRNLVGKKLAREVEEKSLAIYSFAREYARKRGIIIADTKFEFGLIDGKLALIDELLTPDSSRFWDASRYVPGTSQPSFDKQPVRDWLVDAGWNKEPSPPPLPPDVVESTSHRYREAYRRLTGKTL